MMSITITKKKSTNYKLVTNKYMSGNEQNKKNKLT